MRKSTLAVIVMVLGLATAACGPASAPEETATARATSTGVPASTPVPEQSAPTATVAESGELEVPDALVGPVEPEPVSEDERFSFSMAGWKTDWTRRTVSLAEISSGGPPRDGIPPIYEPRFRTIQETQGTMSWLQGGHPVLVAEVNGDARAYPLGILTFHEIVNDVVGGEPVAVTYCPLCNTGIGFKRTVNGHVLEFGTSGNLRFSNLVMWDRTTESWWQQATLEGIVGVAAGLRLEPLPVQVLAWQDFTKTYPEGRVLSDDTGHAMQRRYYGKNPYVSYDNPDGSPGLFSDTVDGRLPAMERVVAVEAGGKDLAFPYSALRERGVINYAEGPEDLAVFYKEGTLSALDQREILASRDVGSVGVFSPVVDGQRLTFSPAGEERFVDDQTGSAWSIIGEAEEGELAGTRLAPVVHDSPLWFSWAAFKPGTEVYRPAD